MTDVQSFDHDSHMRRALELAREAQARGDDPFGSVLVRSDRIVMEASNAVATAGDLRRHPELDLATRAVQTFDAPTRADLVMYTSTEPCPMCAGGLRQARLGRVVYSVAMNELRTDILGADPLSATADTILDGVTPVDGPVLNAEGRALLQATYG